MTFRFAIAAATAKAGMENLDSITVSMIRLGRADHTDQMAACVVAIDCGSAVHCLSRPTTKLTGGVKENKTWKTQKTSSR